MMTIGQTLAAAVEMELLQVDGARTLIFSPDPFCGWQPSSITVTLEVNMWRLPSHFDSLRENWERENPNERSDPKVAIRRCDVSSNGELRCLLAPTEWKEVRPWHVAGAHPSPISTERSFFAAQLPNIAVVHVIATTADQKILLTRRGMEVHYHPGAWAASYEEGLAPEDVVVPLWAFHAAAVRGAAEEILGKGTALTADSSHLLAFIAETPLENPAAVMSIELPYTFAEIENRTPVDDELMPGTLESLSLDPDQIAMALCTEDQTSSRRWHPTARYRLLALMLHRFGPAATISALKRR